MNNVECDNVVVHIKEETLKVVETVENGVKKAVPIVTNVAKAIINDPVTELIIGQVKEGILSGKLKITSPMELLTAVMKIVEVAVKGPGEVKKRIVVAALTAVAAGEDGVLGTDDDLIPASIVKGVQALLENNLVEDTINVIVAATKGKFTLADAAPVAVGCLAACLQAMLSR